MLRNIATIGDKVGIIQKTNDPLVKEVSNETLVSQLYDVNDETHLVLAMPMKEGITVPLSIGANIELNFYSKRGLYFCDAIIENRTREDKLNVIYVKLESELERIQRRQYYRFNNAMDIEYQLQIKKDSNESEFMPWFQAQVTDLSGGGVRFECKQELAKDDIIQILLTFSNEEQYYDYIISGKVIAGGVSERTGYYENRVQFMNLSIEQRETIIKYIFAMEREQRRKEKGLT